MAYSKAKRNRSRPEGNNYLCTATFELQYTNHWHLLDMCHGFTSMAYTLRGNYRRLTILVFGAKTRKCKVNIEFGTT